MVASIKIKLKSLGLRASDFENKYALGVENFDN